jgi:hypothetical protein
VVPSTRSLLQAIERLVEMKDMVRMIRIHKTERMLTVDDLINIAIEKGILDVKLTNRPGAGDVKMENQSNLAGLTTGLKVLS